MNCSEFLDAFSDYFDGSGDGELVAAVETHMAACEECRRYRDVVERGTDLLRSFPEVEVSEDFYPRLQHRIYHVDEERAFTPRGSASTATTALGMALILTIAAWAPTLRSAPEVELSPIVVSEPSADRAAAPAGTGFRPLRGGFGLGHGSSDLWQEPNALLFEFSPLSEGVRRSSTLRRTGLD